MNHPWIMIYNQLALAASARARRNETILGLLDINQVDVTVYMSIIQSINCAEYSVKLTRRECCAGG